MGASEVDWKALDCAVRLNEGFNGSVALSLSLADAPVRVRLLNVAEPDERAAEVVPLSSEAVSVIETELVATAGVPFSVRRTTGAGEITMSAITLDGGSVVNASA
jgi:hypothetical protein